MRPFEAVRLMAPRVFCLRRSPDLVVAHFELAEHHLGQGSQVLHDLSLVEDIDAPAALLMLQHLRANGSRVKTTIPTKGHVVRFIAQSGMVPHVGWHTRSREAPRGFRSRQRGQMRRLTDVKIRTSVAKDACDWTSQVLLHRNPTRRAERLWRGALYRTIVEAMSNTGWHASPSERQSVNWWMGMMRTAPGEVTFTFLDRGAGINSTVRLSTVASFINEIMSWDAGKLLGEVMRGEMQSRRTALSSTGKKNRGLGLPAMAKDVERGHIKDLMVVTNNAIGWVDRDEYRTMHHGAGLGGTLFTWRVVRPEVVRDDA